MTTGDVHPDAPVFDDEDLPPVVTTRRAPVKKGRLVLAALALVAAVTFIVIQAGDATVYFRTVDEAVAQRQSLGAKRFRLEGVVQSGTIVQDADALRFRVYGDHGATADIVHRGGQPTGLFRDDIPVVLEGHWASDGTYLSDRVIVKHSETYRTENPDRVTKYPPTGATGS
jgi:cytochrome c-type biogenesis protein CcmE